MSTRTSYDGGCGDPECELCAADFAATQSPQAAQTVPSTATPEAAKEQG